MVVFNINEKGHLVVSPEPNFCEELIEIKSRCKNFHQIWCEVLHNSGYLGNGWSYFDASELGHLSEAPMLAEDVDYDDDGEVCGGVFYLLTDYMTVNEFDRLENGESIIFTRISVENEEN